MESTVSQTGGSQGDTLAHTHISATTPPMHARALPWSRRVEIFLAWLNEPQRGRMRVDDFAHYLRPGGWYQRATGASPSCLQGDRARLRALLMEDGDYLYPPGAVL